ncbi:retinoic acid receptor responder protein 2 [Spea bombifrons]|uniref:retinoic acid receptor responder protein 2 n=1 Tax=Spea bombifrons TaxID=233779 RepID=UPI00234B9D11|nr:retinoic acid receptor responder protein 2 [Spea bombifrons]
MRGLWGAVAAVAAVLAMAVEAQIPEKELTSMQRRAVHSVMREFHARDYINNGFHATSFQRANQMEFPAGIFVRVEFTMKQTDCRKHQWMEPKCKTPKNPRVYNCFTCFKFEFNSHQVISELKDCIPQRSVTPERTRKRETSCKEVQDRNETGELRLPGAFSFLKSQ